MCFQFSEVEFFICTSLLYQTKYICYISIYFDCILPLLWFIRQKKRRKKIQLRTKLNIWYYISTRAAPCILNHRSRVCGQPACWLTSFCSSSGRASVSRVIQKLRGAIFAVMSESSSFAASLKRFSPYSLWNSLYFPGERKISSLTSIMWFFFSVLLRFSLTSTHG